MASAVGAALVLGGVGAVTSAVAAERQNDANSRARRSQQQAAAVQTQQLEDAAAVEREKRLQDQRRIAARLRVAAGESGLALGSGTAEALQQQTQTDLSTNLGLIDQNLANQTLAVESGLEANLAALEAQEINPLIATFTGGLGGASTGLAIGSALQEARS